MEATDFHSGEVAIADVAIILPVFGLMLINAAVSRCLFAKEKECRTICREIIIGICQRLLKEYPRKHIDSARTSNHITKIMQCSLRPLILGTSIGMVFASTIHADILKKWDFEDDQPLHGFNFARKDQYLPEVVPDPKNPANKVMRVTHTANSPRKERAEIQGDSVKVGEDRWVSVRILIDEPLQKNWTCYFQLGPIWGAAGKGRAGLYQLDASGSPHWQMRGWLGRAGRQDTVKQLGPVKIGAWTTWVFHIKLRADHSGLLKAWKDGKKVLTDSGQNSWPGDVMHIQWGIYHGATETPIRAYYDDIVIGNANSSYDEVCPVTKSAGRIAHGL